MELLAFAATGWGWVVLGGVLLALEIAVPGASLLWLGFAAIATGLVAFAVELPWQISVALFALLSVVAVVIGRRLAPAPGKASDKPFLNRRTEAMVGRVLTLERAITDGAGAVRVEDTIWRVEGPDLPIGARVRVVAAEGAVLRVAPLSEGDEV